MDLETFKTLTFPLEKSPGVVYVLCYVSDGSEIPFYVGQSGRFSERMGDYDFAAFNAQTDFKVGEAIKYMRRAGLAVVVKYRETADRHAEETELLQDAKRKYDGKLLNSVLGFDYKVSDQEQVLKEIHEFCRTNLGICAPEP